MATKKKTARPLSSFADLDDAGIGIGYRPSDVLDEKPSAAPAVKPERSTIRAVGDLATQFAGGAVSGVRMMTDLAGADNRVSKGLRSAEEALSALQSAAAKADQQEIATIMKEAEGKGWGEQIASGLKAFGVAPGAMMAQALGTSLPTLATAVIPGAGPVAAAARLGMAGAVGGAQGAGNIKGVIYEDVKRELAADPTLTPEQIEARAVEAQSYGGENAGQIALGGGLGVLAGSTGMERVAAGLRNGVTKAAPGMLGRVGMGAVTEAVPEALQGGQEKFASNTALVNEGMDVDPWSGVVAQGTMEAAAGGVMGGAFGIPNPDVRPLQPTPGDQIRATEKVPEGGPMARAANVATEQKARQVDMTASAENAAFTAIERQAQEDLKGLRDFAEKTPEVVSGMPVGGNQVLGEQQAQPSAEFIDSPFADRVLTVQEMLADPATRESVRARWGDEGLNNIAYYVGVANRTGIPEKTQENLLSMAERLMSESVLTPIPQAKELNGKVADPLMLESRAPDGTPLIGRDQSPSGRFTADSSGNVAPETRVQQNDAQRRSQELASMGQQQTGQRKPAAKTIGQRLSNDDVSSLLGGVNDPVSGLISSRRQAIQDMPSGMTPRTPRADAQELDLPTDPVANYIDGLRQVNTPAAKLYVRDFDAGSITRADVEQRMTAERGKTPDERLAAAAAEGLRMNPKGDPFKTLMAAQRAAKTTPGDVIEVQGGYAIRPQQERTDEPAANQPTEATAQPAAADADGGQPVPPATGEAAGALTGATNVQNAPQPAAGTQAQTPASEAPAPASRDAAPAGGVPAAPGAGDVQADGVKPAARSAEQRMADGRRVANENNNSIDGLVAMHGDGLDPDDDVLAVIRQAAQGFEDGEKQKLDAFLTQHTAKRKNGTYIKDGRAFFDLLPEQFGQASWLLKDALNAEQTPADVSKNPPKIDTSAAPVQETPKTAQAGKTATAIRDAIAESAIKRNRKHYAEQVAKNRMTQEEADRRALVDEKTWSESKVNERMERIASAIDQKDPTVLIGAWANDGQGTYGNEGSMEAFRKLTGINLKRMNSADRAKAIFDWAGWSEDQVRADVAKRKTAKAEADAANEAKRAAEDAAIVEKQAAKMPIRIKGKDGETTAKAYIDDLIEQGYTEIGQSQLGAVKKTILYNPKTNSGPTMAKGVLADYAKVAADRFKTLKSAPKETAIERRNRLIAEREGASQPKTETPAEPSTGAAPASQPRPDVPETNFGKTPDKPGVVNVPADVAAALEGQLKKQKARVARLTSEAQRAGMTLDEKTAAQTKVKAAEATLRQMRTSIFDAEDAAIKALASGNVADFSEHADLFGDAAAVIQAQAKPAAPAAAPATPDALSEREKAAKEKMKAAAAKLADLLGKNTRLNITPEQEQKLLPIVIELFDGAMELGFVKFKQAARYVRDFIAQAIDQDAADSIPIDTLQGAYIATARRHADKDVTPKAEVVAVDSVAELEEPADQADTDAKDNENDSTTTGDSPALDSPMGSGLQPAGSTSPIRGARKPRARAGRGDDADVRGSGGRPEVAPDGSEGVGDGSGPAAVQSGADGAVAGGGQRLSAANFRPQPGGLTREGSWLETARRNIDLIDLAIAIDKEGRPATREEQARLSKYVGFGAGEIRNKLFPVPPDYAKSQDPSRLIWPNFVSEPSWKALAERMEALPREWQRSVLQSSQYAHYTSESIIRSVWSAIQRLGFTGGKVFEPGMGIGSFVMLMPENIAATSKYTGVEFDGPTALIARLLSPDENMLHGDFIKKKFPKDFFDVNVGNPPFSLTKILGDPAYEKFGFMLHDFFFAKGIDSVRPGGLQVFITSKGTMDKQNDKARKYLSERADLIGAIRLPSTAFEGNAGTSVVTDVIFLRKRLPGEAPGGQPWGSLATVETKDGPVMVNEYYAANPGMVLGEQRISGNVDDMGRRINSNGRGGEKYTVVSYDATPAELDAKFAKAVESLPENVYSVMAQSPESIRRETAKVDFDPTIKHDGAVYLAKDGAIMRVRNGVGQPLDLEVKLSPKDKAWFTGYVQLRDLVQLARHAQNTDGNWQAALKKLNKAYDQFRAEHGPINDFRVQVRKSTDEDGNVVETETRVFKNRRLYREDYDQAVLTSIEQINEAGEIVKGPFLLGRTIGQPVTREVKSIGDALAVSLDNTGIFDIDDVARRMKLSREEAVSALDNQVYQDLNGKWLLADEYLSGNVVDKLEEAEEAARLNPAFERNVEALKKVQPEKLGPSQISAKLGASWIPAAHVNEFAQEIGAGAVTFDSKTETWQVDGANLRSGRMAGAEYGTAKRSPSELLEAALNSRSVKITMTIDKKTVTDEEGTLAANEAVKKIKAKFKGWIWTDTERAAELVEGYNKRFNNLAPRVFDGSHLTLPGVSLRFKLHPHQLRAILRQVQTGDTYLAHAVGAGKTIEMIAGGMEQKRLGLIKKPMYVVPNHMLEQFSNEFMELYPLANIMVADDENFSAERRKAFIAAATLNAPDAIVITHDAFQRIGVKEESVEPIRNEILSDLEIELSQTAKGNDTRVRRSQLEQQIEAVGQRFDRIISAGGKDATIKFEDMGVDFVYVDEAHAYRKLDFHTGQQIKGIDPSGSKRALDMYVKTRILQKQRPGRAMVFATGTPVTNTMGELYTIMRFFAPKMLDEAGISSFDAWARQFAEVAPALEQNAAGKYELVERFAKFDNVPELMSRVRAFMDVLTSEHLGSLVKRPDLIGGKPNLNVVQGTPALKEYMEGELARRIEISKAWKPSPQEKGNPDPIVSIITDGRFAALDPRFFGQPLKPGETSILTEMAAKVVANYKAFADTVYLDKSGKPEKIKGGTQIVFYNLGFGEAAKRNRGFDSRAAFTKSLTDGGIPRAEIAWFDDANTDAKKEAIFKDMRSGKLKVLIGSAKKMGTGVNVQVRLRALHYQDPPWYPSDVEQPHGRIIRQGNQNPKVNIEWYTTKGTYQSTMWQMVGRKQRFIDQAFMGDKTMRSMDDLGEASLFEQAAAVASGDPRALQLAGLKQDVERLERLQAAHASEQVNVLSSLRSAEWYVKSATSEIKKLAQAFKSIGERYFSFTSGTVDGATFTKPGEFGQAIKEAFNRTAANSIMSPTNGDAIKLGDMGQGIEITMEQMFDKKNKPTAEFALSVEFGGTRTPLMYAAGLGADVDAVGLSNRFRNAVNGVETELRRQREILKSNEADSIRLKKKLGAPFEHQQEMLEKYGELKALEEALRLEGLAPSAQQKPAVGQILATKAPGSTNPRQTGASEANDTDVVFSQGLLAPASLGPKPTLDQVQRLVDKIQQVAKNVLPISVVADPSQIAGLDVPVGTKPSGALIGGRVYLFAGNLKSTGDAYVTLFHELFHLGLQKVIPAEDYAALLTQFARGPLVQRYVRMWKDSAEGTQKAGTMNAAAYEALAAEEALAMVSEELAANDNMGSRRLPGLVKVVLSWMAKVADRVGMPASFGDWMRGLSRTDAEKFVSDMIRAAMGGPNNLARVRSKYGTQVQNLSSQTRLSAVERPDGGGRRSAVQQTIMDAVPQGVMDRLSDISTSQRGFNRWWHRTVGTQLHKAKTNKQFAPVYYAVQDFMKDVSRMATLAADQAPDLLPQVDTLGDVKKLLPQMGIAGGRQRKADVKQASDALFDGTLRYTRNEDGAAVPAQADDAKGVVWTNAELKARGMSAEAIKLYRQARAAIEQSLDNLLAADVYRMATAMKPEYLADDPAAHAALMDKARKAAASGTPADAVKMVRQALQAQAGKAEASIRQLRAKQMDTATQTALKDLSATFNSIQDLLDKLDDKDARVDALKDAGYAPLMRFGQYTVDAVDAAGERVHFGMYESQMAANQAARKFREQGLAVSQGIQSQKDFELLKGVSPETAMLFADMMGMEQNEAMQAWLQKAVAQQSALKRHIRRKGVEGFDDDASRVVAAFITSNSRAASRALHGMRIQERVENVRDGDVKDEAIALAQYVENPKEEAQALRTLLFVNYIGGSVASALVNLTQTVVQTFPYLSQFGGPLKAGQRLASAMKAVAGKITDPALAAAVKRAEEDGVIKPQEVFQLQAEASRTMGSDIRIRAGLAVWGSFFQAAETFNRRVAFIAAYQTAQQQGIADPFAFAENAVDETQGVFNKGARPNWARGAVGATLFTFRTFTIQYVEFLKRLPAKEKALALGVLVLLSGIRGIPFAADAEDLLDTVAQGLGYNFTTKEQMDRFLVATLGSGFADFLQHGASTIPGMPFDVSTRLGMADLLPGTGLLKKSETRKEDQVLESFGVAGSFVRDGLKGEFRPIAIRNLAKGLDMYDRGIYTDTRGRKVMDVDGVDAAFKSIGLQPGGVAAESRAVSTQYEKRALFTKVKGEISEAMALGQFENDRAKVLDARAKLDAWNEKNPEARIVINSQAIRRRVVEMRRDRADRFVRSAPKELRAATREALQ